MKKKCVSRQPEVGARALTQDVERNRTDASEAKTSEAKAPLRGLSCPISREIGDRDSAQARSSRGTRRTLCCRFSGLAKGEISKRNSTGAKGFTLAEVLLTLAIIGVVAALTIPAVITKVTKDQYVVGLKKAYNTLKAVEREAVQEHGPMENWDWTGTLTETFNTYFRPHFDILKDCGADTDDGCFVGANEWKAINGTVRTHNYNDSSRYRIITSDGIAFVFYKDSTITVPERMGIFNVDVNGKKGPNILGRDIFAFTIYPTKGIKPEGMLSNTDENSLISTDTVNNDCNTECTGNSCGWYCAVKVLSEGAMNY